MAATVPGMGSRHPVHPVEDGRDIAEQREPGSDADTTQGRRLERPRVIALAGELVLRLQFAVQDATPCRRAGISCATEEARADLSSDAGQGSITRLAHHPVG